jgi:hypothetical protein
MRQRLPPAVLAAWVMGLVTSPFGFIVTGALSDFSPLFGVVVVLPMLVAVAFLLRRFLARPAATARHRSWVWLLEVASWLLVLFVLYHLSGAMLTTGFARLGIVWTFFLTGTLLWLPVLLLRPTALEARLARRPWAVHLIIVALIMVLSVWVMVTYLTGPPRFIGDPRP